MTTCWSTCRTIPPLLRAHGVEATVGTAFGDETLPRGLHTVVGRQDRLTRSGSVARRSGPSRCSPSDAVRRFRRRSARPAVQSAAPGRSNRHPARLASEPADQPLQCTPGERCAGRSPSQRRGARRLADRQDPPRVVDRHAVDLGVRHARLAQPRQERRLEVRVAVPLVPPELAVVAHVLAQQDPLTVAAMEQLQQELDDPALAMALGRGERHAEEVELDRRPTPDQRQVVVEDRVAVGVPDHHPPGVDPLFLEHRQLRGADVGHDGVGRDREARPA